MKHVKWGIYYYELKLFLINVIYFYGKIYENIYFASSLWSIWYKQGICSNRKKYENQILKELFNGLAITEIKFYDSLFAIEEPVLSALLKKFIPKLYEDLFRDLIQQNDKYFKRQNDKYLSQSKLKNFFEEKNQTFEANCKRVSWDVMERKDSNWAWWLGNNLVLLAWIAMGVKDLINKCCFEMIWTHALTTYRLQKNVGLCCPRHFLFVPISPKAAVPHFLFFLLSVLTSNTFCLASYYF